MSRNQFLVRWRSGGTQQQVPVPFDVVADGRDAAHRIAERVKERIEASEDATDQTAAMLFRDQCIAEENQARAETAPIVAAMSPPPDVGAQHAPLVAPATHVGAYPPSTPPMALRESKAQAPRPRDPSEG